MSPLEKARSLRWAGHIPYRARPNGCRDCGDPHEIIRKKGTPTVRCPGCREIRRVKQRVYRMDKLKGISNASTA